MTYLHENGEASRLSIHELSKRFDRHSVLALDSISIEIDRGELLVLLGPSGCGKTTLLRSIAGLEEPSGGRISLFGDVAVDVERGINVPPNRRNVGMVFQNYVLWPHMKVVDNVAYPLKVRGMRTDQARREAAVMLDSLQCGHLLYRYPSELSGGQQQRIALARCLVANPAIALFDEPLSNIDAQLRRELRAEIHRLHREYRFTGVYVTHDQHEGLQLGDRVAVMRAGRIEQLAKPAEVYASPVSSYVARFLGVENSLAFQIDGDSVRTQVGNGEGNWTGLAAGRSGTFETFVRSRDMSIKAADSDLSPVLKSEECALRGGVLTDVLFGGDRSELVVTIDGRKFFASVGERTSLTVGQTVNCHFQASEALTYPVADSEALSIDWSP